ncbi:MAG: LemA family protein [Candidatus Omnitrophica bacterium]|nr:LemA family protein [Candidatus Omnitrophota bacterium]
MKSKEQIEKMVQEGKVTREQANMLLQALEESQARRKRILKNVFAAKNLGSKLKYLIITIVLLCVLIVIVNYNKFIVLEKAVEEARGNIGSVCQRRLDLIPNLVNIVKGYMRHENEVLMALTQARSDAQEVLRILKSKEDISGDDILQLGATQDMLTKSIKNIVALAESYPDIKASSNFLALQDQLEGTENRVNIARLRYNYTVRQYNQKIKTFPGNFLAKMCGFKSKAYFEADNEAFNAIKINF